MSRFKPHNNNDFSDALANFSLTFAKAMLVFCVILMVMISPQAKQENGIKPKIDYLITIGWPPGDNDVDIWMRDPDGKVMYYGNKEVGVLNLERDDLGNPNNTVFINDRPVINDVHEEQVSIRGKYPGEYIINLQLYRSGSNGDTVSPLPVDIRVTKLNPSIREIWHGKATLTYVKEEQHVVRFVMKEDGDIISFVNDLPISLIEAVNAQPNTATAP